MKIPIKKYVMDDSLPWKERYRQLEAHHEEETTWMIEEIKRGNGFGRSWANGIPPAKLPTERCATRTAVSSGSRSTPTANFSS
jgi:hypothetical protein